MLPPPSKMMLGSGKCFRTFGAAGLSVGHITQFVDLLSMLQDIVLDPLYRLASFFYGCLLFVLSLSVTVCRCPFIAHEHLGLQCMGSSKVQALCMDDYSEQSVDVGSVAAAQMA